MLGIPSSYLASYMRHTFRLECVRACACALSCSRVCVYHVSLSFDAIMIFDILKN